MEKLHGKLIKCIITVIIHKKEGWMCLKFCKALVTRCIVPCHQIFSHLDYLF